MVEYETKALTLMEMVKALTLMEMVKALTLMEMVNAPPIYYHGNVKKPLRPHKSRLSIASIMLRVASSLTSMYRWVVRMSLCPAIRCASRMSPPK